MTYTEEDVNRIALVAVRACDDTEVTPRDLEWTRSILTGRVHDAPPTFTRAVVEAASADPFTWTLKIEGDTLSLQVKHPDTPEARGRVCNVELALLKCYGSHRSEAVVPLADGRVLSCFHRGDSDHALYARVRKVLQGFCIEV